MSGLPSLSSAQVLAVAVIRQAVHDLAFKPQLRGHPSLCVLEHAERDTRRVRNDARDFLLRRLWLEEWSTPWHGLLLELGITRAVVEATVKRGKSLNLPLDWSEDEDGLSPPLPKPLRSRVHVTGPFLIGKLRPSTLRHGDPSKVARLAVTEALKWL